MELSAFFVFSVVLCVLFGFHCKSRFPSVRRKHSFFIENKSFNLQISARIAANPFLLSFSDC